jgi:hypothetical protein
MAKEKEFGGFWTVFRVMPQQRVAEEQSTSTFSNVWMTQSRSNLEYAYIWNVNLSRS